MNIAPTDADVWDIRKFGNSTHVTPEERGALGRAGGDRPGRRGPAPLARHRARLHATGTTAAGAFHQDLGMRIDLVLAGAAVQQRVRAAWVDRQARKGSGPSDHAPVMVDLDEAPDGDIGPVVPPPSAPRRAGWPTPSAASRPRGRAGCRAPARPAGRRPSSSVSPTASVRRPRSSSSAATAAGVRRVALQLAAQLGQRRRRSRPAPAPPTRPAGPPSAGSPPARRGCRDRARPP